MQCIICKSKISDVIDTEKHYWYQCDNCKNAFSKEKNKCENKSAVYDYFTNFKHIKKQAYIFQEFMLDTEDIYEICDFNFTDKHILDISGGNGHFVKKFQKLGAVPYLTEYNEKAIEYASNVLKIRSFHFDFQDVDKTIFQKKFDLILLRNGMMFCTDLKSFITKLREIMHSKTILIIHGSLTPSLDAYKRFENDDYIYKVLYDKDYLYNYFINNGFDIIQFDYRDTLSGNVNFTLRLKD